MTTTSPYGAWPSPISADDVARAGLRLSFPVFTGGADEKVWWTEGRPVEGGRQAVVSSTADGSTRDVLPAPWNARTRVHEYGGRAFLPVEVPGGHALVFAEFTDQRLYRLDPGATEPVPLTPPPDEPAGLRYADLVAAPGGRAVWCVRESHRAGERPRRHIVSVPLDGSGQVTEIVSGSDFLAWPRPAPDGRSLAWVAWDHPRMPWDGTELRVGALGPDGAVHDWAVLLGGPDESVCQPEWAGPDTLYAVSDRTGWWNLYRVGTADPAGAPVPLCPREEEFAGPLWGLGMTSYAVLDDGRLAVLHGVGQSRLGLLDPKTGSLTDLDLPYSWSMSLDAAGSAVVGVGASPLHAPAVLRVDLADGSTSPLRQSLPEVPDPAYLPRPTSEVFTGPDGDVHAHVFAPTNPQAVAPAGELPPYVAFVHGGPTAHVDPALNLEIAYFTSRGIGVVVVNYGGSSGYGRAYRERLREQWGVVDVADVVAAVRALADRGLADPARLAIRGGSAGGWTTLAALTGTDVFAAGTSYYGVAELLRFAADTHDFESRYLDGLVGPLPDCRDRYVDRAPLSHVDDLSCPVLLLQGAEDRVVPPSQAEMFRDALARKGIPHAHLVFAGEQHGFRHAETKIACLQAELSFYGQALGFDPPGVDRLALTGASD